MTKRQAKKLKELRNYVSDTVRYEALMSSGPDNESLCNILNTILTCIDAIKDSK